jgi:glucose/arabinose dehydrogenase
MIGIVLLASCAAPVTDADTAPGSALTPRTPDGATPDSLTPDPAPGAPATTPSAPGLPSADLVLPSLALTGIAQLDAPIDTAVLADGTVLVAQRAGVVRVLIDANGAPSEGLGRVVIDVSDRTTTDGERGLLSIAVSPQGDELFLSLTDPSGDTRIEAHPFSDGRVTGPPRTVYTLPQPRANHNGGPILFAPDGMLLVGLGDGGGSGDPLGAGQDLSTPLGSILRLDVRGSTTRAPSDNPFLGVDGAAPEIVAYGLRNPWRMSLDGPRGELWIADVGQSAREEINRVRLEDLPGANFGWALREGSMSFQGDEPDDHLAPIHDYAHGPGCSVTGGHVYRGSALPELVGAYVFSDWCDGELRVLLDDRGTVVAHPLGLAGERVVGFGRDADGELLVLELSGRVLRLGRA